MLKERVALLENCDVNFCNAILTLERDFHTYDEDPETIYEDVDLDEYEWHSGVSKVCIIYDDVVLKKSFSGYVDDYDCEKGEYKEEPDFTEWDIDYAELEYQVYLHSRLENVSMFFAEMISLENGVYAQEKCDIILEADLQKSKKDRISKSYSEDTISSFCINNNLNKLPYRIRPQVLPYFISEYTPEELKKLEDFMEKYDINDIHTANVGWFNGRLKIFDYCGYGSSTSKKIKEFSK